jgi:ABC-type transport system substrate-binding protein
MVEKVADRGLAAFSFVVLLFLTSVLPLSVQATQKGNQWTGPWIEKLVYKVIPDETDRFYALINGDVDIIGGRISTSFFDYQWIEDIEVTDTLQLGYGITHINCAKYPMNITNFRRAVAFALDKHRIIEEGWLGLAQLLDCHIPRQHPASIEDEMTYHYYDENVAEGIRLLELEGFIDSDDDGWREGPGPEGPGTVELNTFVVWGHQSTQIDIFVDTVIQALLNLNISAESRYFEERDWWRYYGDYDMEFHTINWNNLDLDFYARDMSSDYVNTPLYNTPNWSNATWDSYADIVLHSTDYDEIIEAVKQMEKIWVYSCPSLVMYQSTSFTAYRTDEFEGITPSILYGASNYFTNMKIHRKSGDIIGGTYSWAIPKDILSFNHYSVNSEFAGYILDPLFDSLVKIGPDGNDILWMCEDYQVLTHADDSSVPEGQMRILVDVIQNATWSDGTPITAEDFAFSLNFIRNNVPVAGADLFHMFRCYAVSSTELLIEFDSVSFWHWHNIAYKRIIPEQVWIDYADAYDQYQPSPSNLDEMMISGAFLPTTWAQGEFVELSQNSMYFRNPRLLPDPSNTTTTSTNHTQTNSSPFFLNLPISLQTAGFGIGVYIVLIIVLSVDYIRSKKSS